MLVIDDGLRIFIKVRGDIYNLAKLKRPNSNEAQTVTAPVIPTRQHPKITKQSPIPKAPFIAVVIPLALSLIITVLPLPVKHRNPLRQFLPPLTARILG